MKKMSFVTSLILCAFITALLPGCSSSDSETSADTEAKSGRNHSRRDGTQAPFNSCDLLTSSDILPLFPGAAIKITTRGDSVGNPIGQRICSYEPAAMTMPTGIHNLL